jgi:large subunit ribosomal protein L21
MYAVIETGGKQYKVMNGDKIHVERLEADVDSEYTFDKVLFISGEVLVKGRVLKHLKGEKVTVFKFKKRKQYRRRRGHRQQLTLIEILGIEKG